MGWNDEYGDIDPYEDDDKPSPSEYDGDLIEDDHGEYNPYAGSQSSTEGRCNCVLRHSYERYGEKRYCTALPESCFVSDGSDYCKTHKSMDDLVKQQHESFVTGAYSKSYADLIAKLPLEKRSIAVNLFGSLMEESKHEFEPQSSTIEMDTEDADWFVSDVATLEVPIPTTNNARAQALFYAALDFVKIQNINEKLFSDSLEEGVSFGETEQIVSVGEDGREHTNMVEHHLNLPLSRIQKDYKEHLEFGGVDRSTSSDDISISSSGDREWRLDIMPEDNDDSDDIIPIEEPSNE